MLRKETEKRQYATRTRKTMNETNTETTKQKHKAGRTWTRN